MTSADRAQAVFTSLPGQRVLDTDSMAWTTDAYGRRTKIFFRAPQTSCQLVLLSTQPGSTGRPMRYHTFHEWHYRLRGDVFYRDPAGPDPSDPDATPYRQFREGFFLHRRPHSLHGGARPAQFGGVVLVMEEGHLIAQTFALNSANFLFVLKGDLSFAAAAGRRELGENFFADLQPSTLILSMSSETGCVWLEVSYLFGYPQATQRGTISNPEAQVTDAKR